MPTHSGTDSKRSPKPAVDGVLNFPFFTIENVDVVDESHIVAGNDNNLPFSTTREPNKADDNEIVMLEVDTFLKAREHLNASLPRDALQGFIFLQIIVSPLVYSDTPDEIHLVVT